MSARSHHGEPLAASCQRAQSAYTLGVRVAHAADRHDYYNRAQPVQTTITSRLFHQARQSAHEEAPTIADTQERGLRKINDLCIAGRQVELDESAGAIRMGR